MADAQSGGGKSSLAATVVVLLLLTLIGAGTGFAVGALVGAPPPDQEMKVAEAAPGEGEGPGEKKKDDRASPKKDGAGRGEDGGDAEVIAAFEVPAPVAPDEPLTVVPLQPIITNLAAPQGVWLRVEASILVKQGGGRGGTQTLAEETGASILAYLRTLSLQDIEGASAFLAFRDDLDDLVRTVSRGAAAKVLVKSLVVE